MRIHRTLFASFIIWTTVFGSTFTFGAISINFSVIFAFLSLGKMFFVKIIKFKMYLKLLVIYLLFFILIVLSFLINSGSEFILFIMLRYIIKAFFIPVLAIYFAVTLFHNRIELKDLQKVIAIVFALQTALTTLQLSSPEFRTIYFSTLSLDKSWQFLVDLGHYRSTGLSGLALYDTSVAYFLLYLSYLLACKDRCGSFFVEVMILVLAAIAGRTGFGLCVLLFTYSNFLSFKKSSLHKIIFTTAAASYFVTTYELEDFQILVKLFEILLRGESASTNDLIDNHLFIPWDVSPLLGDFMWSQETVSKSFNYPYATDSGPLSAYISLGIPGLLLSVVFLLLFLNYMLGSLKYISPSFFKVVSAQVFFLLISIFLYIKAPIFFSQPIVSALILLIFSISLYKKRVI